MNHMKAKLSIVLFVASSLAAMRWGGGSRILRAGFTEMGDAKIAIDRWAEDLRKLMDQAHGRESQ
jgi:hypothetical protein